MRYRRGSADLKRQLRWFAWGSALTLAGGMVLIVRHPWREDRSGADRPELGHLRDRVGDAPDRGPHRDPPGPSLRHRPAHQPDVRVQPADRDPGRSLLRPHPPLQRGLRRRHRAVVGNSARPDHAHQRLRPIRCATRGGARRDAPSGTGTRLAAPTPPARPDQRARGDRDDRRRSRPTSRRSRRVSLEVRRPARAERSCRMRSRSGWARAARSVAGPGTPGQA